MTLENPLTRPRYSIGKGIRSRIFLLLFAVIIPVLIAQAWTYYNRFQAQRVQELQANLEIARAVEQTFSTFVRGVVHQQLAIGIGVKLAKPTVEEGNLILDEISAEFPAILDFSLLDPSGLVVSSSDRVHIGLALGEEPYVQPIIEGRDWILGPLLPTHPFGQAVFMISRAIRNTTDHKLEGIVVATVFPEMLDLMSTIERAGQGGIIIVDRNGLVVYSYPAADWTWERRHLADRYPDLLETVKNQETTTTLSIGEQRWMVALTPILDAPGWVAGAGRPEEVVMGPVVSALVQQGGFFLFVVSIAVILALALSRTITVPLRKLREHASNLGRGELDHKLETNGPTELEELSNVFNQMAEKIRRREAALQNAHDELENRVKKRTLKLAEINEALEKEIAERRKAEESLKIHMEKLEWSNRELQDFAFVASHDLQEPLRKIQAFGDLLKEQCRVALDKEHQDYLERMQSAAGRMQALIHALLTYSRVTTTGKPFVPVDLDAPVQKALSNLEVRIKETRARIDVKGLPSIEADPSQMMQLFQNLIGNALKFYRDDTPPLIEVSAEIIRPRQEPGLKRPGQELCVITVKDNGIGFEQKDVDRIFLPFQRLHGRGEYDGTGIGLAICRKIAERHGGSITAESKPGGGSRFIVTLPRVHREKMDKGEGAPQKT